MRFDVSEANMAALNRRYGKMGMGSRRSSTRVGSQSRRGLGRSRLDDGDGYDEESINPRGSSIRDEPRRRRGIDSRHLDDMDGFNDEDIDPRRPSTRGASRKKQDTGLEYMDRPVPSNFPHARGGSHRSRSPPTNPHLPLAELLAELDKAQEEKEKGEKAMLGSLENSVAYNEGLEQRDQAKLRIEQVTEEIYKHDPDQDDMDRAQRIAMHLPSKGDRTHEVGGSSRSRRGPTANRAGEHGRKGHTSVRGGGQGLRHSHGGHREDPKRLEFY